MIYGYCRISTGKQSIDRQIRNIKSAWSDAVIVEEIYTGTRFQGRDKLDKIIKEYPETFDWMKMQADRLYMSLSKVLHEYEDFIDELMCEEDNSHCIS